MKEELAPPTEQEQKETEDKGNEEEHTADDAEDAVLSEDEMDPNDFEATVPEEWQRVMSTRTLREGTPLPLDELLSAIGAILEGKVKADAADPASRVSLPTYTWQWASTTHGSHKLAEVGLASIIKGVEKLWASNSTARLFGELNGMLKEPHDDAVNRKVLGLLSGEAAICEADMISYMLTTDGDGAIVAEQNSKTAIARLNLPEAELEKVEAVLEKGPTRLDVLLLATIQPVRDALAEAAEGDAAEVGEEEGTDRVAADEEAAAEVAVDEEAAQANANAERVSAALDWAAVVAKLPIGTEEKEGRVALYNACANGATSMSHEQASEGLLKHLKLSAAASEVFSPAVDKGLALAGELCNRRAQEEGSSDALSRWGFFLLVAYLRHFVELLMTLNRLTAIEAANPISEDEFRTICGKLADWNAPVDDPMAEFLTLSNGGELSFDTLCDWCLKASVEAIAASGEEAAAQEEEAARTYGEALLPPSEPLDPVLERTERSNFDESALGSVHKGFFDASKLDSMAEGGGELEAKLAAALEELEKLKSEKAAQDKKMATVLDANETMRTQLKELNMVVEGVVKRELQRVKAAKAGPRGRSSPTKFGR